MQFVEEGNKFLSFYGRFGYVIKFVRSSHASLSMKFKFKFIMIYCFNPSMFETLSFTWIIIKIITILNKIF